MTLNVWLKITNSSDESASIQYTGDDQPNAYSGGIAPGGEVDYPFCDSAVPMDDSTAFTFNLGWGPYAGDVEVKNPWINYPYWWWANLIRYDPDGSSTVVENDNTIRLGEPDTQVTAHGVYRWTIQRFDDGAWTDPSGWGQVYKCIQCTLTKEQNGE